MYDTQSDLPAFGTYISRRIVRAAQITEIYSSTVVGVGPDKVSISVHYPEHKPIPAVGWWILCYEDGYVSFCPPESFVTGYQSLNVGREGAYAAIDSERAYQDAGRGNAQRHEGSSPKLMPGEVILCIEKCLHDAREAWYKPNGGKECLPYLRKVAALAVQAMENYGAPLR
jgi:hypothetical protein